MFGDSIYYIDAYITPGQPGYIDKHGNSSAAANVVIGSHERINIVLWCRAWYRAWTELMILIDDREILEIDIVGPHQLR